MAKGERGGSIEDHAIKHKLRPKVFYPRFSPGVLDDAVSGIPLSLGAGTPGFAELLAAAEFSGLAMDDADEWYRPIAKAELWDFNFDNDIGCQLLVGSAKAAATHANIDFTAHIKGFGATGGTVTDTKVSADGSIVFPAMSVPQAGGFALSALKGFNLTSGVLSADDLLGLAVTLADKGDGAADETILLAVILWGTAEICSRTGLSEVT